MAYEGELLLACPNQMFDFSKASAVIVSGDGPNRWGHMLLNTGGIGGMYFQVVMGDSFPQNKATPRYMNEAGYQHYLRDTGKKELRRFPVPIPRPQDSQLKLEQMLSEPRWWWGAWHNCEGLVEEIIVAGGGPKIHQGHTLLPTQSAVAH